MFLLSGYISEMQSVVICVESSCQKVGKRKQGDRNSYQDHTLQPRQRDLGLWDSTRWPGLGLRDRLWDLLWICRIPRNELDDSQLLRKSLRCKGMSCLGKNHAMCEYSPIFRASFSASRDSDRLPPVMIIFLTPAAKERRRTSPKSSVGIHLSYDVDTLCLIICEI